MGDSELLIKACISGDSISQTKLYNLYAPKMLAVCLRYSKDKPEAEEIMLEGFMRVFTYLKKFSNKGSLEGWIRKIMINCALDRHRNKLHLVPIVELTAQHTLIGDSEDMLINISARELITLIQRLSPAYRVVFNLYVFEGYKHYEIAKMLSISEGTSKSNLSDARKLLQKALKKKDSIPHHNQIAYG